MKCIYVEHMWKTIDVFWNESRKLIIFEFNSFDIIRICGGNFILYDAVGFTEIAEPEFSYEFLLCMRIYI